MDSEQLKIMSNYFEIDFTHKIKQPKIKPSNKDLMLADVHTPFQHKENLEIVLEDTKGMENLWIVGDWWDFYSKSHYRKTYSIDFKTEFREGFFLLQRMAMRFNKVYLMLSNHDQRFKKWIFDNVPADALAFCDYLIVEKLIGTIPNVIIMKQKTPKGRLIDYIYQHKNALFTHIEKSNKDITKTAQEIVKDLLRWEKELGIKNYELLFQAHNHQSGKVRFGDKWVFQIPCLIDMNTPAFDYAYNGKLYGNPPALGYTILYKNSDGSFNPAKTHIIDL